MKTARVLWGEGLFLRPQHFQLQDLHHEAQVRDALLTAQPLAWGVRSVEIDAEALGRGVFRLERLDGVLPDGTAYRAPERDLLPPPLDLAEHAIGADGLVLHLAVPRLDAHGTNVATDDRERGAARYHVRVHACADLYTDAAEAEVSTLRQAAWIKTAHDALDQFCAIPLARVQRTPTHGLETDKAFLPPLLAIAGSGALQAGLKRLLETLQAKADALHGFHREPSKNIIEFRSGDVASFWLLHTVNTAYAALLHLYHNPLLHPERMYQELLRLAGGLMTFAKTHTLDDLPPYRHGDPAPRLRALDAIVRELLETVISTRYFAIALAETKPTFHVGRLTSDSVGADSTLYLAVSAAQPLAELVDSVPARVKVGAPDDVDKLVLSAMGGVKLSHAPQVPAAIPVRPGACYFQLEARGPLYERMLKARAVAIYAPTGYQDLKLELLAVTS